MLRVLNSRPIWFSLGVIGGLLMTSVAPQTPVQAVATDRLDTFLAATAPVGSDVEAIFLLDGLTGDLKGMVMNPMTRTFTITYQANLLTDLKIEAGKQPKFVMVTGTCPLRTQGQFQFAQSLVYVSELTTGNMVVYAMPFNPSLLNSNSRPVSGPLTLLTPDPVPIRAAAVRN